MMQQLQKQGGNGNGGGQGQGNSQFSLGAQLPHHNRSESAAAQATPVGGGLDRQMIGFVAAKHHNISVQQHERKTSGTPQPMNQGVASTLSAVNKKKK